MGKVQFSLKAGKKKWFQKVDLVFKNKKTQDYSVKHYAWMAIVRLESSRCELVLVPIIYIIIDLILKLTLFTKTKIYFFTYLYVNVSKLMNLIISMDFKIGII